MRGRFHRSLTVAALSIVPKQSRARQQAAGNDAALTSSPKREPDTPLEEVIAKALGGEMIAEL
jgi:hypothetical protein